MDTIEAIREALPLSRLRGYQEVVCDDGSVVLAQELDDGTGFAIAVSAPDGSLRAATPKEVESAGFPYRSTIELEVAGQQATCAWTPWG